MSAQTALAFLIGLIGGVLLVVSALLVMPSHICIEAKAKDYKLEQCLLETKENGGSK